MAGTAVGVVAQEHGPGRSGGAFGDAPARPGAAAAPQRPREPTFLAKSELLGSRA